MKKFTYKIITVFILICMLFSGCSINTSLNMTETAQTQENNIQNIEIEADSYSEAIKNFDFDAIPAFNESPYVEINSNIPFFKESDWTTESYETYGELDDLSRCTTCMACIGKDLMPTEERGTIGQIKPSGWHSQKYDNIDGKYLYNRCHLIGYQLTAENANPQNLITGTRYLNVTGMLKFEDMVADYIEETENHVMYRVTPLFKDNELVARGVLMEGYSVEDNGKGICYNVYCYNNQPGIEIDYKTGESKATSEKYIFDDEGITETFIVNTGSKKFHKSDCTAVEKIKEENKKNYIGTRESLIDNGYSPCKQCNP